MGDNGIPATPDAKAFHRHRITISGKVIGDTSGTNYCDFFYNVSPSLGNTHTYVTDTNQSGIGGTGVIKPTANEVPFNAEGIYTFTIDTTGAAPITFNKGLDFFSPFLTGTLTGEYTIEIVDVGEYLP